MAKYLYSNATLRSAPPSSFSHKHSATRPNHPPQRLHPFFYRPQPLFGNLRNSAKNTLHTANQLPATATNFHQRSAPMVSKGFSIPFNRAGKRFLMLLNFASIPSLMSSSPPIYSLRHTPPRILRIEGHVPYDSESVVNQEPQRLV